MTVAKNRKRLVRDIQSRTGWPYAQCKYLVDRIGYELVSRRIDDNGSTLATLNDLKTHARKDLGPNVEEI